MAKTGLDPLFEQRLAQLRSAVNQRFGVDNGFQITSGFRSPAQQAQIIANNWDKFDLDPAGKNQWLSDVAELGPEAAGSKWETIFTNAKRTVEDGRGTPFRNWIALPSKSQHQHGYAGDLNYASQEIGDWIRSNAKDYGLAFPLGNEPWHIELAGARDNKVTQMPLNASSFLGMLNPKKGEGDTMQSPQNTQSMGIVDYLKDPQAMKERVMRRDPTSGLNLLGRFGVGLDALVLQGTGIGQQIAAQGQARAKEVQSNMTAEWFDKQPNGALYAQMLRQGIPAGTVYAAYIKAQEGDYVVVGNSLVDRKTGKVLYTDPNKGGKAAAVVINPDGTISINPPEMKQEQSAALLYGDRMEKANQLLAMYENQGGDFFQNFLNNAPWGVGRAFQTEEFKSFDDARRDFVNAVLRRESGAAIAPSEFESAAKQYFPVFGDSPQQIKEKRERRERAAQLLKAAAGPEANKYLQLLDAEAKKINPNFGTSTYDEERKKLSQTSKKGNVIIE